MPQAQNIEVVVVVSGQPERLRVNVHQTLRHVVHEALQRSRNPGQDAADWELRTEAGELLNQDVTVATAKISSGVTLFLSPRTGAGG